MTNLTLTSDLSGLLGGVEAATGPDRELDAALTKALDAKAWAKFRNWASMPCGAPEDVVERDAARSAERFTASLDAALGLCERVLPGGLPALYRQPNQNRQPVWDAHIRLPHPTHSGAQATAKTPALALLGAMLRALIAQGEAGTAEPLSRSRGK